MGSTFSSRTSASCPSRTRSRIHPYRGFGTPEAVADRLLALREQMSFMTLSLWMNPGGTIPNERVLTSMRLFAERVAPRLA